MPEITISYRRKDSDAITGRIRDRIARDFGDNSVFMDIDNIPLGIDFRKHIQKALREKPDAVGNHRTELDRPSRRRARTNARPH